MFTAAAAVLLSATTAFAHHPFAQTFDRDKPVTLMGTVTKVQWTSPHVYTYLDVKDDQGKMTNWKVEMGSPQALMKNGWTKATLKMGQKVTLQGWRARNGTNLANAEEMTMPDGQKLSAASSINATGNTAVARNKSSERGTAGTSGKKKPASTGDKTGTTGNKTGTQQPTSSKPY